MTIRVLLIILLLAIMCQAYAPFPVCRDETPNWTYDGYCWIGAPVPGLPNYATQFLVYPTLSIGKAVFYGPQAMAATAYYRGLDLTGYVGGVALMTCGNLGEPVWLHRPGEYGWEGPYRVVDCARRNDLYGIVVYREEVVEVDFNTARRWGMIKSYDYMSGDYEVAQWMIRDVLVSTSYGYVTQLSNIQITNWFQYYKDWFLNRVAYSSSQRQDWQDYHSVMLLTINKLTPEVNP